MLSIGLFQAMPALAASDTVAKVSISPGNVKIQETARLQFTAQAYDASGNKLTDVDFVWSVEDADAGSITEAGLFTASSVPDKYSDVVKVVADTVEDYATVTVIDSDNVNDLERVVVTPARATVESGDTVELLARGYDDNNVVLDNMSFTWTKEGDDNTITETTTNDSCVFTAGDTNGTYTITATEQDASDNDVTGTAEIKVTDDATSETTESDGRDGLGFGRDKMNDGNNGDNSGLGNSSLVSILTTMGLDFEDLRDGTWNVENDSLDAIYFFPGEVTDVTDEELTIDPNGDDSTATFDLTSTTVIRPNNTELKDGQNVIVITTDDAADADAIMVLVVSSTGSQTPPGLQNNDNANGGNSDPSGWSNGNKTGWWDKVKNFFGRNK